MEQTGVAVQWTRTSNATERKRWCGGCVALHLGADSGVFDACQPVRGQRHYFTVKSEDKSVAETKCRLSCQEAQVSFFLLLFSQARRKYFLVFFVLLLCGIMGKNAHL